MQNKNLLKWAVYALAVVLTAVFQGTPHLLPAIAGDLPAVIVPCVLSVAIFEGETPGAVFGIAGGLLWDIEGGRTFGYHALLLMVMCIAVALLIQNLFRNTVVAALIFSVCATALIEFLTWFFFIYLAGDERLGFAFLRIILPTVAYTAVFAVPFYYGAKYVHRRFRQEA